MSSMIENAKDLKLVDLTAGLVVLVVLTGSPGTIRICTGLYFLVYDNDLNVRCKLILEYYNGILYFSVFFFFFLTLTVSEK